MEDAKNFLTSKTVIGLVISFIGIVMGQFGFDSSALTGATDEIVQLAGLAIALYGRFKAVKKIKIV